MTAVSLYVGACIWGYCGFGCLTSPMPRPVCPSLHRHFGCLPGEYLTSYHSTKHTVKARLWHALRCVEIMINSMIQTGFHCAVKRVSNKRYFDGNFALRIASLSTHLWWSSRDSWNDTILEPRSATLETESCCCNLHVDPQDMRVEE